jgi:hypothetical protein
VVEGGGEGRGACGWSGRARVWEERGGPRGTVGAVETGGDDAGRRRYMQHVRVILCMTCCWSHVGFTYVAGPRCLGRRIGVWRTLTLTLPLHARRYADDADAAQHNSQGEKEKDSACGLVYFAGVTRATNDAKADTNRKDTQRLTRTASPTSYKGNRGPTRLPHAKTSNPVDVRTKAALGLSPHTR